MHGRGHLGSALLALCVACSSAENDTGQATPDGGNGASDGAHTALDDAGLGDGSQGGGSGGSSGATGTGGTIGAGGSTATGGSSGVGGAAGSGGSAGSDAGNSTGGSSGGDASTDTATPTGSAPFVGGCRIFPDDNPWNQPVDGFDVDTALMTTVMPNMALNTTLHPDWGTFTEEYGIPITVGTGAAPVPMHWTTSWGNSESDQLPCSAGGGNFCYPIPLTAKIEGGTSAAAGDDRHVLYLDTAGAPNACKLYELYNAQNPPNASSGWDADNGLIFDLGSNALRPDGWTSADAAGLPVLPGLVRFDEANGGEIKHAIRFTMNNTYQGYIHPATHAAGLTSASYPPMGLRLRLKPGLTTGWQGAALAIGKAMEKYGVILADNGSNWYLSGDTNDGWASVIDDVIAKLKTIHGHDFEIVKTGSISQNGL